LHAWDDTELSEPWNVCRCDVLRVLNTEPAIARTVFLCDALENVELCADRPITNGVHDHLQTSFVALRCPPIEVLFRIDEETGIFRRIVKWSKHRGGMRAQRSVSKSLQSSNAHPFVAFAAFGNCVTQALPLSDWSYSVDASDQLAGMECPLDRRKIIPCSHVRDRCDASLCYIVHRSAQRSIIHLCTRRRHHSVDVRLSVVLENSCWIS